MSGNVSALPMPGRIGPTPKRFLSILKRCGGKSVWCSHDCCEFLRDECRRLTEGRMYRSSIQKPNMLNFILSMNCSTPTSSFVFFLVVCPCYSNCYRTPGSSLAKLSSLFTSATFAWESGNESALPLPGRVGLHSCVAMIWFTMVFLTRYIECIPWCTMESMGIDGSIPYKANSIQDSRVSIVRQRVCRTLARHGLAVQMGSHHSRWNCHWHSLRGKQHLFDGSFEQRLPFFLSQVRCFMFSWR